MSVFVSHDTNITRIHISSEKRRILNLLLEICQPQTQNETFQRKKKITLKVGFRLHLQLKLRDNEFSVLSSSAILSFFPSCQKTSFMNKVSSYFSSRFFVHDIPVLSHANSDIQLSNRMYCYCAFHHFYY